MREIKFRAWNGTQLLDWEWIVAMGMVSQILLDERNRYKLLQYTGLKDKTGKEIYEGDIYRQTWQGEIITGEVIYGDMARFWLRLAPHHLVGEIKITGEVIGNIWENSELLK